MLLAVLAVLAGVVVVATGRGGELSRERADYAPLELGNITATDVVLFRAPAGLWGYSMSATEEALDKIAVAIRDRDVRIIALEQRISDLIGQEHYAPLPPQAAPAQPGLTPPQSTLPQPTLPQTVPRGWVAREWAPPEITPPEGTPAELTPPEEPTPPLGGTEPGVAPERTAAAEQATTERAATPEADAETAPASEHNDATPETAPRNDADPPDASEDENS
jgi:hypothetical protein